MITLRCTSRLQKYLDIVPATKMKATTAVLGDWYANLIPTVSGDLIVFVNEKTLLSVAIPVWEANNLIPLFHLRVTNLLGMIGIPHNKILREIRHYDQIQFSKTKSRSIVGSMNDIAWEYQGMAEVATSKKDLSLSEAELRLSEMPCKPINYRFPSEVAKELLESTSENAS
jgi:hypothetical protein